MATRRNCYLCISGIFTAESFYVVTRRRFRHYWMRMISTLLCTPPDLGLPISDPGWCMRRTESSHPKLSPIVSETMQPGPWT